MTALSRSVRTLVLAGAGSAAIATAFIGEKEGNSLKSYQDGAGVWTICRGHTAGVGPNQRQTEAGCDRLFASDVGQALAEVDRIVSVPMSDPRRAAVASFCAYNLGLTKCARSTFIRRLNAGDPGACDEIMRYVYVGGQDCRDPSSNCRGIVVRREQETALCKM